MTLPVALLLGLLAGSAVAWLAQGPLRDTSQPLRTRYGAVAALFGAGAFLPATLCLFLLEPSWALMYLAHPDHAAALVWPAIIVGSVGAPILGLKLGHSLLIGRGTGRWWAFSGGLAGLLIFCLVAGLQRLGTVAFYEVFHYGAGGVALTQSALFWPVMVVNTLVPLLLAFSLVQVQRHATLTEDVPRIAADNDIPFKTAGDSAA